MGFFNKKSLNLNGRNTIRFVCGKPGVPLVLHRKIDAVVVVVVMVVVMVVVVAMVVVVVVSNNFRTQNEQCLLKLIPNDNMN